MNLRILFALPLVLACAGAHAQTTKPHPTSGLFGPPAKPAVAPGVKPAGTATVQPATQNNPAVAPYNAKIVPVTVVSKPQFQQVPSTKAPTFPVLAAPVAPVIPARAARTVAAGPRTTTVAMDYNKCVTSMQSIKGRVGGYTESSTAQGYVGVLRDNTGTYQMQCNKSNQLVMTTTPSGNLTIPARAARTLPAAAPQIAPAIKQK